MQKTLISIFSILISFLGIFASSHFAFAQTLDSSVISTGGDSFSSDVGATHYPDSQYKMTYCGVGTPCNILDVGTSTIISLTIISGGSVVYSVDINGVCGSWGTENSTWISDMEGFSGIQPIRPYSFNSEGHCTSTVYAESSGDDFYVWLQYVPYDTRITTMPLSDTHFAMFAGFFISFCAMIFIIGLFKKRI